MSHHLIFYKVRNNDAELVFELGPIEPNESMKKNSPSTS
jgi:hypothetical protein